MNQRQAMLSYVRVFFISWRRQNVVTTIWKRAFLDDEPIQIESTDALTCCEVESDANS